MLATRRIVPCRTSHALFAISRPLFCKAWQRPGEGPPVMPVRLVHVNPATDCGTILCMDCHHSLRVRATLFLTCSAIGMMRKGTTFFAEGANGIPQGSFDQQR